MKQRPSGQRSRPKLSQSPQRQSQSLGLPRFNLNAAGIDVGAAEHWVAVPVERDAQPVRRFGAFSTDLYALAQWLKQCGIETVVMESTGIYWVALFEGKEGRS